MVFGLLLLSSAFLFGGCAGEIEIGPVPTVTPRPAETARPTLAPTPIVEDDKKDEGNVLKRNYKEQYMQTGILPSISEVYKDKLLIGLSATQNDVTDEKRKEIVTKQFGYVSCKTELSAGTVLDYAATRAAGNLKKAVLDFKSADTILQYAKENGKTVMGPVLISHEMPNWFFTEHFSEDEVVITELEDGKTETKLISPSSDVMLARMENYIKDMMEYCNTNYPDVVVSWDVVSDAIHSSDRIDKKLRNSAWYQTVGEEYIYKAYEFANNYRAQGQKLYYSEDELDDSIGKNSIVTLVKAINEKTTIDGFSIVIPYTLNVPNTFEFEDIIKLANQTGLELHLTGFCVSTDTGSVNDKDRTEEESLEKVAKKYKAMMSWVEKYLDDGKYNITSVTFAGLSDDEHPDNQPKEYVDSTTGETVVGVELWNYAYLFDKDLNVKDAFFGALQDDSLKAY